MPVSAPVTSTWHLVIPVKDHHQGKSRLHPPHGVQRSDLALAIALDTLDAALQVVPARHLVVVSNDEAVGAHATEQGAELVMDPGRGLNAAIDKGIARTGEEHGPCAGAVLLGDLPALTPDELYDGLRACAAAESSLVPDYEGTGTVLLAHHDITRLQPRFGTGSAARHERSAARLELDLPRLRTDVDDDDALAKASDLGVGPHTAAVLHGAGPGTHPGKVSPFPVA